MGRSSAALNSDQSSDEYESRGCCGGVRRWGSSKTDSTSEPSCCPVVNRTNGALNDRSGCERLSRFLRDSIERQEDFCKRMDSYERCDPGTEKNVRRLSG